MRLWEFYNSLFSVEQMAWNNCGYFVLSFKYSCHICCFRLLDSDCIYFAVSVVLWLIHATKQILFLLSPVLLPFLRFSPNIYKTTTLTVWIAIKIWSAGPGTLLPWQLYHIPTGPYLIGSYFRASLQHIYKQIQCFCKE